MTKNTMSGCVCGASRCLRRPRGAGRLLLATLLTLAGMRLFADVIVVAIDQELDSPLEGVKVSVQGSDASYTTDAQGEVTVRLPEGAASCIITGRLLGYGPARAVVSAGQKKVELRMSLEGSAIEGQELVVEAPKPQATDAQPGVSQVVGSQDIQTQTMGVVEDAISAVKTLPGVGYSGVFNAQPSIDGGDPKETVAILDGAYVLNPYQWSGTFTIFNPDAIDSIKLSTGVIGASYGQVISGLLEVNTKTPSDTEPHFDFGISTTGLDLFYQQAFGDRAGVLLGGKITWMELPLALIGESSLFATDPYIRNGTAMLYWKPTPSVKWSLDANVDTDGVAVTLDDVKAHLFESEVLVSSKLQVLLGQNLLWNLLASYNSFDSDAALTQYDAATSTYTDNSLTLEEQRRYQLSTSFDWTPSNRQVLSFGVDELLENWSEKDGNALTGATYSQLDGKNTLSSGVYASDAFTLIPGTLTVEGGLRLDHDVVYGGGELIQTYPVVNPRVRLTYVFLKNAGPLASMAVNAGTGLYSQFPADNPNMDETYGVRSLEVGPTRAWINSLGVDATGNDGATFSLQGYAKYYRDRFYSVSSSSGTRLMNDGIGYVYGFAAGFRKRSARWDLSLSYTYNYIRLYNPGGSGLTANDWTTPLGTWYFPYYEAFHTAAASLAFKPSDGFSILLDGHAVSGSPTESGSWTLWRYPVDVKLDWHGFYAHSKLGWEFYVGCDDIFALLYSAPLGTTDTGVSFDVGYPIPSVGYKLSY